MERVFRHSGEMAEDTAYQQLLQKYTGQSLSEVYKEGTDYRITCQAEKEFSEACGIGLMRCSLADYDKHACARCARHLTSIMAEERWAVDEARLYWCGACRAQRPLVQVQHDDPITQGHKMPRQMQQVLKEIQDHPSILQLNNGTRQMLGWLSQEQRRSTADNRYIRDVWSFLYKGTGASTSTVS